MQIDPQDLFLSPDSIIQPTMVESNLPLSLDASNEGDAYLEGLYRLPYMWRWRLPEMQNINEINKALTQDMQFNSFAALDSFAAFGVSEEDVTRDQTNTYVAPDSRGQSYTDILSGLVRGLTPAATNAINRAVGYQQPTAVARPQQVVSSTSKVPVGLIIGGVAVIAVIALVAMKK